MSYVRHRFGPGLLTMAFAAMAMPAALATPPGEERANVAAGFTGAIDRLLTDGPLKELAYRLWKESGCGFGKSEYAAWIVASEDLELSFVAWPHLGLISREVWRGAVPANVVAIVHTHPDAVDPRPSDQDAATARLFGIPNYTLSRQGIWKATADGDVVRIDGEAWFVRCNLAPGCGVKAPSRAAMPGLPGRPGEPESVLP